MTTDAEPEPAFILFVLGLAAHFVAAAFLANGKRKTALSVLCGGWVLYGIAFVSCMSG